jgi:hypothetical protein
MQAPVLLLGLLGAMLAWRGRQRTLLLVALWWVVVFTLPYAVAVAGNTRFRLPAEPAILVLGAYGLAWLVHWRAGRWRAAEIGLERSRVHGR